MLTTHGERSDQLDTGFGFGLDQLAAELGHGCRHQSCTDATGNRLWLNRFLGHVIGAFQCEIAISKLDIEIECRAGVFQFAMLHRVGSKLVFAFCSAFAIASDVEGGAVQVL